MISFIKGELKEVGIVRLYLRCWKPAPAHPKNAPRRKRKARTPSARPSQCRKCLPNLPRKHWQGT